MERNLDNREFEQYIKRNADQYRMIPSEKVWKGINNNLHTRRKWYGLGLTLLLVGTATAVTWVMLSNQVSQKQANKTAVATVNPPVATVVEPAPVKRLSQISSIPSLDKLYTPTDNSNTVTEVRIPSVTTPSEVIQELIVESDMAPTRQVDRPVHSAALSHEPAGYLAGNLNLVGNDVNTLENNSSSPNASPAESNMAKFQYTRYPESIESVMNSYKAPKQSGRKKLTWQIFFTPTVSYRKLSDNKSFNSSAFFVNNQGYGYPFASTGNVNKAVTHKPDLGLELGFAAAYPLSSTVKLTAGMQFNINRYDIRAYVYNREPATINLNGGDGNNSVTTWTSYRNYNGYKSDWLKNFYFSVSAPIGAQFKLLGNNKTSYGIASTVQPTYILRDRAYLISTDYKNYAEIPDLVRHFNVNTSFEAFVSYKSHNTRWQIGPQVRYQVMSSFQSKYPVKENLFDFGIKVGILLNQ